MSERDRRFVGADGKRHDPADPDPRQAKISELKDTVQALAVAVMDLQHRLSRFKGEGSQSPGGDEERGHSPPSDGDSPDLSRPRG